MVYNNIKYTKDHRFTILNDHLQKSFQHSMISFSTNQDIITEQFNDIYRKFATVDRLNTWVRCKNSFNIDDLIFAIKTLDSIRTQVQCQ